jgi:hypothetical protein
VGATVGSAVGAGVGATEGSAVGAGVASGEADGSEEGDVLAAGDADGSADGSAASAIAGANAVNTSRKTWTRIIPIRRPRPWRERPLSIIDPNPFTPEQPLVGDRRTAAHLEDAEEP